MATILNPYIHFNGNAREAITFYESVFGGELNIGSFKEMGMDTGNPADEDLIMHSQLTAPNGLVVMASDTPSHMTYEAGASIGISLSGDDDAELRGYWEKLSEGAKIEEPLTTAPWGDSFGMLVDKFGIDWMVNITAAPAA